MPNTHSTDLEKGSTQYWSIADASQTGLDFSGDMSISLWVKLESAPATGNFYLVSKYEDPAKFSYRFLYTGSSLYFSTSSDGTSNTGGAIAQTLNTGTWYHVGVSKSGTTGTIYVDGSSIGTVTNSETIANTTAYFGVGPPIDDKYDGLIDDVIVYSAAIGDSNMETNYSNPCSPYLTDAVSRWKFDDDAGVDDIGTNDLTNNNTATFSTDVAYSCAASGLLIPRRLMVGLGT